MSDFNFSRAPRPPMLLPVHPKTTLVETPTRPPGLPTPTRPPGLPPPSTLTSSGAR